MDNIIDLMAYHGSTVTRADIHAVKEDMLNAIEAQLTKNSLRSGQLDQTLTVPAL